MRFRKTRGRSRWPGPLARRLAKTNAHSLFSSSLVWHTVAGGWTAGVFCVLADVKLISKSCSGQLRHSEASISSRVSKSSGVVARLMPEAQWQQSPVTPNPPGPGEEEVHGTLALREHRDSAQCFPLAEADQGDSGSPRSPSMAPRRTTRCFSGFLLEPFFRPPSALQGKKMERNRSMAAPPKTALRLAKV